MPITIPDDRTQTNWDGATIVDEMLDKMKTPELERFIQTLRMHMQTSLGKNDIVVEKLLQLAECNQFRRD